MKGKKVSDSETIVTEVVCPNHTNPMGFLSGGQLLKWMDTASAVCAQTHSARICVTASIDHVNFRLPAKIGDIITIKASITRVFDTSMEIFVQAWAKKVLSQEIYLINEAFFTFVSIDDNARPTKINPVIAKSLKEKMLYTEAAYRKQKRIKK